MQLFYVNVFQIDGYYGKCMTKVEPAPSVVARILTTQISEMPVTLSSVPLAVENYDQSGYRMMNTQTSQRILPPPELDCLLTASQWSPPFPVCREQMTSCRNFAERRASSAERYCEDSMSVELRSHAAVDRRMSDYEGL